MERIEWVRCSKCNHKLFKAVLKDMFSADYIEIKCSSCKNIENIRMLGYKENSECKLLLFRGEDVDSGHYLH